MPTAQVFVTVRTVRCFLGIKSEIHHYHSLRNDGFMYNVPQVYQLYKRSPNRILSRLKLYQPSEKRAAGQKPTTKNIDIRISTYNEEEDPRSSPSGGI